MKKKTVKGKGLSTFKKLGLVLLLIAIVIFTVQINIAAQLLAISPGDGGGSNPSPEGNSGVATGFTVTAYLSIGLLLLGILLLLKG